ncbi:hypothetical protein [Marinobacter fonticola]|uniref:hypothetical protein n=1 Tax=Marinobacter fonticola TaxID=2603215 RepID=UPI0011E6B0BF|nr:hypothetical protein [Marinobacter fonticola]
MNRELKRRLAALEKSGPYAKRVEIWIKPPADDLHGWECGPETVMRLEGETDDELEARAKATMKRLYREKTIVGGLWVYFGIGPMGNTR